MPGPEPPFDPRTPNAARMHAYWTGGHVHYAADRAMAAEVESLIPPVRQMVTNGRLFVSRAVTWAAVEHQIRQFIDLGSGLPSGQAVHRFAAAAAPSGDIRAAYVDSDPEVIWEAARILGKPPPAGVAMVTGDLRDPAAVLSDPGLLDVIDPAAPVLLLAALVLHFMPAGQAREVIAGYAGRLAPGSIIAVSVPRNDDPESFARLRGLWPALDLHNHTRPEIVSFFTGMDLVPPGVVLARGWRGDMPEADVSPGGQRMYVLGAAARVRG